MSHSDTALLESLGLDATVTALGFTIPAPNRVAHGRATVRPSRPTSLAAIRAHERDAAEAVHLDPLGRLALEVRQDPGGRFVLVRPPVGQCLSVRALGGALVERFGDELLLRAGPSEGVVIIGVEPGALLVLRAAVGDAWTGYVAEPQPEWTPIDLSPVHQRSDALVMLDPWLADHVHVLSRDYGPVLGPLVAMGVSLRYAPADDEASFLQSLLRGEEAVPGDPPELPWARALSTAAFLLAEVSFAGRVRAWGSAASSALASLDPARILEALETRDDLEGAALLLERAGAPDARALLTAADAPIRSALPIALTLPPSERLERALDLDPDEWWALPDLNDA